MQTNTKNITASAASDWAILIGRLGLAALFLWSGYGKLTHSAGTAGYMTAYGMPAANILVWPVAFIEVIAGAMLALGWKTKWAALALFLFTLPATFIFHAYWSVPADQVMNQQIHFMKNLAILGGLLSVFAHGSAGYSLDRR